MSFDHCLSLLSLQDKLPVGEIRETAKEYAAEGMEPGAAMAKAVAEHLAEAKREEAHIVATVREKYVASGGKLAEPKAEAPQQEAADGKHEPIHLVRMSNAKDFDWNRDKPNGTYASLADDPATFKSPFASDYPDGQRHDFTYTPKNPLVVGDLTAKHARFKGTLHGEGETSAGIKALHAYLPKAEFDHALALSKAQVQAEIAQRFPDVDTSRAHDAYEALEIWGAQEAKARGHDVIVARDSEVPALSEAVLLSGASAKQTDTPAFRKWFGDSVVRGEDGKPLVVYHATTKDFDAFDRNAESIFGYGDSPDAGGIFFDADPKITDYYASPKRSGARIIPAFLRIENPARLPANQALEKQAADLRAAEAAGHDGAILGGKEYVVFKPEQVKSATGNSGAFDPASPDIRYSVAYHGSPYKFDKFTVDHIGSGEGNQAFGWGLYFAGDRAIADYYRKALSGLEGADGKPLDLSKASPQAQQFINEQVAFGTDPAQIPAVAKSYADASRRWDAQDVAKGGQPSRTQYIEAMDEVAKLVEGAKRSNGQLYEVEIPERETMLQWDKPLSEQPESVQKPFVRVGIDESLTGQMAYYEIGRRLEKMGDVSTRHKAASLWLHERGVNGIAYLDHNSRGNENDSHNYVVFDDTAISILKTHYSIAERQQAWPALREVSPLVQSLADKGAIVLHQDATTLPVKGKAPSGVQALTTADGTIHVVANALGDNAKGVILHEAFHAGGEALVGSKAWTGLTDRLGKLYALGEKGSGTARAFFDAARARVETAKAKGAVAPGMEHEEFGAYAIEEYAKAPLTVRKWVDDLLGAVKAWALRRFGKQLGDVTPAQLSSLAKLALLDKATSAARERSMQPAPAFSADSSKTIEVDGQRRPIENSKGQLIAPDMHKQMAFWRNFSGSKAVDDQGRPLILYHGTRAGEINSFDRNARPEYGDRGPYSDLGDWFTTDQRTANRYADEPMYERPGDPEYKGAVYPVYLKTENPKIFNGYGELQAAVERAKSGEKLRQQLIDAGHDGIAVQRDEITDYVTFRPEQVKSATGNAGEFGDTPDIRYSVAGAPPAVADEHRSALSKMIGVPRELLKSAAFNVRMAVVPMAAGAEQAMAMAKDFANHNRRAATQWAAFDKVLKNSYSDEQLKKMWVAADQENDLRREGRTSTTEGLASLTSGERKTVELLHAYGEQLWAKAKEAGLVSADSEGVHYWTPRMAANIVADGSAEMIRQPAGEFSKEARNLRTSASSTKQRKHETTTESEAALKAKLGEDAEYVKNIRVMPMAMAQLEKAIAGRTLVNQIKAHGKLAGDDLVSDEGRPNFVTFDHPALKQYRPKMDWQAADNALIASRGYDVRADGVYRDGEKLASYRVDGGEVQKLAPLMDSNGKPVMESFPLFVRKDFAGPLKAVFATDQGAIYNGLMSLKGGVTSMIMISPLTHNLVIWGKAMPTMMSTMGWKNNLKNAGTLGMHGYFIGNRARADHALMQELTEAGLVPVSGRGMNQDVAAVHNGIQPGRSLTAKALGSVADLASPKAGEAVRRGVDAAGHFWHETLLWDRVADLQAGMAVMMRTSLMDKGLSQDTANRIASHFANRYAGMIPREAMSEVANKIANLSLFSKSFTMTNLGAYKDLIGGLPKDVQAQIKVRTLEIQKALGKGEIEAETTARAELRKVQSVTRKKAAAVLVLDVAAMAAVTSLAQALWEGQDGKQIAADFRERLAALGMKMKDDPLAVLGHPLDALSSLSQTADNPHGKEDRVRVGEDDDGNSYYARLPVGKVGEELKQYGNLDTGMHLLRNKMSTFLRPIADLTANEDFTGKRIIQPHDNIVKQVAAFGAYWVKSQLPAEDLMALGHVVKGDADHMDKLKLMGTATGLSVGRLSGGDAVAELRHANREQAADLRDVLPDVKEALRRGDDQQKAHQLLEGAGQTPAEAQATINRLNNPGHISKQQNQKFNRHAGEDEKSRLEKMRARAQ